AAGGVARWEERVGVLLRAGRGVRAGMLRVAVDRDGLRDRRQVGARGNRLDAGTGDVESDRVHGGKSVALDALAGDGPRGCVEVGRGDRLSQSAEAVIVDRSVQRAVDGDRCAAGGARPRDGDENAGRPPEDPSGPSRPEAELSLRHDRLPHGEPPTSYRGEAAKTRSAWVGEAEGGILVIPQSSSCPAKRRPRRTLPAK